MGTIYYVGCKDCKVVRDLDKFYTMWCEPLADRQAALDYCKEIERDSFRAGLLVSFMGEHMGHNCVAFTEHNDELNDLFRNDDYSMKEDRDYWHPIKNIVTERDQTREEYKVNTKNDNNNPNNL